MALTLPLKRRGEPARPLTHRISLPLPFPLASVNAWLFPGREPVLVDCGLGSAEVYQQLVSQVRKVGVEPSSLRLFVTHGHVDHAGNARRLRDDFGVRLHAPLEEAGMISTFRRDSGPRNDAYAEAMRHHGMPDAEAADLRARSDDIDRYLEDCPIDQDVPDGASAVFGDLDVEAIRTPGHTDGSVSFYLADNRLLSGDTLLEHITSNAGELLDTDHGSFHQYVQTLESLRKYVGVECLPGHLQPFVLTDEVLDRHLALHRGRRQAVLDLLDRPRTAYELLGKMFPGKDGPSQRFMGMAEIVGHLHAAQKDGLVEMTPGKVRRFKRN